MSKALELLDNLIAEIEISLAKDIVVASTVQEPAQKEEGKVKENKKSENNKSKKESKPAAEKPQKAEPVNITVEDLTANSIELRVGIIRKVAKHETAEKLYCEEIDIGEDAPRAIASGLVPYYTLEQMLGRKLIVVANLKPRSLVGFKSNGMVLCASKTSADGTTTVEFVDPPASSQPGDRIVVEGIPLTEPLSASKCDKMKAFEVVAADLKVDENGFATWRGHRLVSLASGEVTTVPTVRDAPLK